MPEPREVKMTYFNAPLATLTKIITVGTCLLVITIPVVVFSQEVEEGVFMSPSIMIACLPILIPVIAFYYKVTGYQVDSKGVTVKRIGHDFLIPMASIKSTTADAAAMRRSLRTFGNGGLFGFYGRFRNKKYGSYRAFVTSPAHSVVLDVESGVILISPDRPIKFVEKLESLLKQ